MLGSKNVELNNYICEKLKNLKRCRNKQSWAAIDNYMFRPSGGHRQVVHSEVELIKYVRLNG